MERRVCSADRVQFLFFAKVRNYGKKVRGKLFRSRVVSESRDNSKK